MFTFKFITLPQIGEVSQKNNVPLLLLFFLLIFKIKKEHTFSCNTFRGKMVRNTHKIRIVKTNFYIHVAYLQVTGLFSIIDVKMQSYFTED